MNVRNMRWGSFSPSTILNRFSVRLITVLLAASALVYQTGADRGLARPLLMIAFAGLAAWHERIVIAKGLQRKPKPHLGAAAMLLFSGAYAVPAGRMRTALMTSGAVLLIASLD